MKRRSQADSLTSPEELRALQRDSRAIEMRLDGATFEEIANRLEVSVQDVRDCVQRVLDEVQDEVRDDLLTRRGGYRHPVVDVDVVGGQGYW